jgi:penicillin-binding protein 2
MKFIAEREWDADITPSRLFTLLCERYKVSDALTSKQKRDVIGIRYYLELCQFSAYNSPVTISTDVPVETVVEVSARSRQLPGVTITTGARRQYFTTYAAHLLGRVAAISSTEYAELKSSGYRLTDNIGKMGVEKAFETSLRGIDGKKNIEVDRATGQIINEYMLEDPQPGDNIVLTIDIGMQAVAERSLAETMEALSSAPEGQRGSGAEGGAVAVIDARTGEILTLASYPTYNLATYGADYNANLSNTLKPFFNRAIAGTYPPGSTFKMVTALAALEEGIITADEKMHTTGVYMYYAPSYTPACWVYNDYGRSHGDITVSEALKYSCNYFFFEVGRVMGIQILNKYATALGLGQKTGIEIGGEKDGNLAGPESRAENGGGIWQEGETIQAAIGQTEQQFTPLQLASYVATIVNGGTKHTPHIIKAIISYDGSQVIESEKITSVNLNLSSASVKAIKEGMRGVVTEDGTASSVFRNFPIEVGGKTGSAQNTGDRSAHGLFVSFAPYDNPEIAVCVVGEYAGSGGALAPVCLEIYREYFGLVTPETPDAQQPAA